jgi:hypothetical protein
MVSVAPAWFTSMPNIPLPAPLFRVKSCSLSDEAKSKVADCIRIVPNFPKPGLNFKDLSLLLGNPDAFQLCIDVFAMRYRMLGVTGTFSEKLYFLHCSALFPPDKIS